MPEIHEEHHTVSYKFNSVIWGLLLFLTATTVVVAQFDFGFLNVVVAMTIASIKASLVIFFFMHLKYEKPLFKIIVLVVFVLLAIAIGFTFFDIAYR